MVADRVADAEHGWFEVYEVQRPVAADIAAEAAVMLCTWREVLGTFDDFRLEAGDDVLIFGAGPVGLSFVKFGKLLGLGTIGVVDPHANKREKAQTMGADDVFAPDSPELAELAKTRGKPLDAVIDAVGDPAIINAALPLVKLGGTIGVYGVIADQSVTVDKGKGPYNFNLLAAAREMFDRLGPNATILSEVSSISKRDGRLWGHAKDPLSSGFALEAFLPDDWWRTTGREALIFGAGGSALAISMYLTDPRHGDHRPGRLVVTNPSRPRLEEMERIHQCLGCDVPCEYHHAPRLEDNDTVLAARGPGTLVINATGLGKDRPGSPVTDEAPFPQQSIAWDFNYRGDLKFLVQARSQQEEKRLIVEDGWIYFIHGWTQVIAEVFHADIGRERIDELSRLAIEVR